MRFCPMVSGMRCSLRAGTDQWFCFWSICSCLQFAYWYQPKCYFKLAYAWHFLVRFLLLYSKFWFHFRREELLKLHQSESALVAGSSCAVPPASNFRPRVEKPTIERRINSWVLGFRCFFLIVEEVPELDSDVYRILKIDWYHEGCCNQKQLLPPLTYYRALSLIKQS